MLNYGKKDLLQRSILLGVISMVISVVLGHFIPAWEAVLTAFFFTLLVGILFYRDKTLRGILTELLASAVGAQFGWFTLLINATF